MAMKLCEEKYPMNSRRSVSVTKTVPVYPKTSHSDNYYNKVVKLSSLDRQCPTLMYLVLFYKSDSLNTANLSTSSVFGSLKSGLEETLAIWFPAAGRLSFDHHGDDHDHHKLNLWCNNKGAILAEAITDAKISELGDLSQYNHFFEKLVLRPAFDANFSDMPLVVAQVTKFGCGGYSIGIGTSHSLFDGPAAYNFLSEWARSSDTIKEKKSCSVVFNPVHDRATLLSLSSNNNNSKLGSKGVEKMLSQMNINTNINYKRSSGSSSSGAVAIDHLLQLIIQSASEGNNYTNNLLKNKSDSKAGSSVDHNDYSHDFVFKTFHLSGVFVEGLKRKVLEEDSGFSCSSFEVLAALLWKARTKAMGLKKESMACLQFAVDTRNKLSPPLPAGFSGNAYVLASVALSAGEVEKLGHKAIIEKIRVAKECVNNEYVKAYMEGLDLQGPQASLPPLKELTLVSDWTRMPFHNLPFLRCGPASVSPLVPPMPQVAYFMQNPADNQAVDVRIGLLPRNLQAFSSYFLAS